MCALGTLVCSVWLPYVDNIEPFVRSRLHGICGAAGVEAQIQLTKANTLAQRKSAVSLMSYTTLTCAPLLDADTLEPVAPFSISAKPDSHAHTHVFEAKSGA